MREICADELATHNTSGDCWVVINGAVLDVTRFLAAHPGGPAALAKDGRAGHDVTSHFERIGHSAHARSLLGGMQVGVLAETKQRFETERTIESASASTAVHVPAAVPSDVDGSGAADKAPSGNRCCAGTAVQLRQRRYGVPIILGVVLFESLYGYLRVVAYADPATRTFILRSCQPCMITSIIMTYVCIVVDPGLVKRLPEDMRGSAADSTVCRVCAERRPHGSHHCSACDACVAGFDHHCLALGVCIGQGNRPYFVLLLLSGALSSIFLLWGTAVAFSVAIHTSTPAGHGVEGFAALAFTYGAPASLLCLASMFLGGFSLQQVVLYSLGFTSYNCRAQLRRRLAQCRSLDSWLPTSLMSEGVAADEAGLLYNNCLLRPVFGELSTKRGGAPVDLKEEPRWPIVPRTRAGRSMQHVFLVAWVAVGGWHVELKLAAVPSYPTLVMTAVCGLLGLILCLVLNWEAAAPPESAMGDEGSESWCACCSVVRVPLMSHCAKCKRCFARRDHHCGLLDTCIGAHNRRRYMLLLGVSLIGLTPQLCRIAHHAFVAAPRALGEVYEHGFPLLAGDDAAQELLGCVALYSRIARKGALLSFYAVTVGVMWIWVSCFFAQQLAYTLYATGCVRRDARGNFRAFGSKEWGELPAELGETAESVELLPKAPPDDAWE
jgi:hypothetical protein